jgi:hypothetical protein
VTVEPGALEAGSYFWRFAPRAAREPMPDARRLDIVASVPTLVEPDAGASVATNAAGIAAITFAWSRLDRARSYELEVQRDEGAGSRVASHASDLRWPRADVAGMTPGRYRWRVRVGGTNAWSAFRSFSVETPASPRLAPPVLPKRIEIQLPARGRLWQSPWVERVGAMLALVLRLVESPAEAAPAESSSVSWPAADGAVGYVVQIARDDAFRDVVREESVTVPQVAVHDLAPGLYWLRVAAEDPKGQRSDFSAPSELTVRAAPVAAEIPPPPPAVVVAPSLSVAPATRDLPPQVVSPVDGDHVRSHAETDGRVLVTSSWRTRSSHRRAEFDVEVVRDEANAPPLVSRVSGELSVQHLAPGRYLWRVRRIGGGAWSSRSHFAVTAVAPSPEAPRAPTSAPAQRPDAPPLAPPTEVPPRRELALVYAPTSWRYTSPSKAAGPNIRAQLFDSFRAAASVDLCACRFLRPSMTGDGARTATVLFRRASERKNEAQRRVSIAMSRLDARIGVALASPTLRLGLAAGATRQSLALLRRGEDGVVSSRAVAATGASAQISGEATFGPLETKLAVELSHAKNGGQKAALDARDGLFEFGPTLAPGHLSWIAGARTARARYHDDTTAGVVQTTSSSLHLGLRCAF